MNDTTRDALVEAMAKAIWLTPIRTVLDHKMAAEHALDAAMSTTGPDGMPVLVAREDLELVTNARAIDIAGGPLFRLPTTSEQEEV